MNDEIKEILDSLKFVIDNPTLEDEVGDKQVTIINYTELNAEESKQLLDYITNLQQENEELKLELSGYRSAILKNDDLLGLQKENRKIRKSLEKYMKEAITLRFTEVECGIYRQRIDKAIEYMKKVSCNNNIYFYTEDTDDVLGDISKILGGDE